MIEKVISFLEKRKNNLVNVLDLINLKHSPEYKKASIFSNKLYCSIENYIQIVLFHMHDSNGEFAPYKNKIGIRLIASVEQLIGTVREEKSKRKKRFNCEKWNRESNYFTTIEINEKKHENIPVIIVNCNKNITLFCIRKDFCGMFNVKEDKIFHKKTSEIYQEIAEKVLLNTKANANVLTFAGIEIIKDNIVKEDNYYIYETNLWAIDKKGKCEKVNNTGVMYKDCKAELSFKAKIIIQDNKNSMNFYALIENSIEKNVNGLYEFYEQEEK